MQLARYIKHGVIKIIHGKKDTFPLTMIVMTIQVIIHVRE